jgi:caffeoyl-CoA O-methyltransferase
MKLFNRRRMHMKRSLIFCSAAGIALLVTIAAPVWSQDSMASPIPKIEGIIADKSLPALKTVLDRYIEALGGRETIMKLTSRICTGQFVEDMSSRQPPVNNHCALKAAAEIPDRWIVSLTLSNGTEKNGYDGKTGWKQNPDRIEIDNRMGQSWMGFLFNPQGPLRIDEYYPGMHLTGKEVREGRWVYRVESRSVDGDKQLLFDTESGLLSWIGQRWHLQNYREVDGVQFPHRITASRQGGESYFLIEDVIHNSPVEKTIFSVPDHREAYSEAFEGITDPRVLPMLACSMLTYTHEDMNVPCKDGRFLYDLILEKHYQRGLEIGTFTGYSTLWMGLAFKCTGGRLITLEIDEGYGRIAQENFQKAGLGDIIDSHISDALQEIPRLDGMFDFVFIDAWKPDYIRYLQLIRDRMIPGGAIVAHNVTNYAQDMQDYLEAIKIDPDLESTFNEISDEGMSISIVRTHVRKEQHDE